jgi:hypothetical protein
MNEDISKTLGPEWMVANPEVTPLCRVMSGLAIIQEHLDTTLTLMIAGHRVGHYSAEGRLLTPLTKKQIKAVEKTLKGKVQKQTFPFNLQIPQNARDSHFPTAPTTTR